MKIVANLARTKPTCRAGARARRPAPRAASGGRASRCRAAGSGRSRAVVAPSGALADPFLAALVDLFLPERHVAPSGCRSRPCRRRARRAGAAAETAITTEGSPISTRPTRWWIAIVAQLVALAQAGRELRHHVLGHALVRLVVEVRRRCGRASGRACVPEKVAIAPASSLRTSSTTRSSESGSSLSRNAPPETGGISATSSPSASAVSGRRVLLVDGVEQPARARRRGRAAGQTSATRRGVDLALRPAGSLAQAGEEPHRTVATAGTPSSIPSAWRPPTGARPSRESRSSRSTRPTTRPDAVELPGRVPVHARALPRHVPRAAVDDPPVRRASPRRRSRTRATAICSSAARPGSRSRSTCRRSSATTPTIRARSARSAAPASRSTRSPTWRSCSTGSRSTRCRRR